MKSVINNTMSVSAIATMDLDEKETIYFRQEGNNSTGRDIFAIAEAGKVIAKFAADDVADELFCTAEDIAKTIANVFCVVPETERADKIDDVEDAVMAYQTSAMNW